MLSQLFDQRGLELNTVARFDNATLARTMLESGVGLTLMRDEQAILGREKGTMAVSPIARAQLQLFMAHLASRRNDPLIVAFLEAATDVWPDLRVTPTHAP
jgi:DNA-binding transcriptional LysR family regulator